MKTFPISALARQFGLSRSTLLYYDRIGLLKPSGRTGSGYRYYTVREHQRLTRISHFRQAGLSIKEILVLLASKGKPATRVLEKRMRETGKNIAQMRNQQRLLSGMLKHVVSGQNSTSVDKKLWVEMLRAAGVDEASMKRWHAEFEDRAPSGHQEFLVSLGIPEKEVAQIRQCARTDWKSEALNAPKP